MIHAHETTHWPTHSIVWDILKRLDQPNRLVLSTTWTKKIDYLMVKHWVEARPTNTATVVTLFDPDVVPDSVLPEHHPRINYITTEDICFFLMACERYFIQYTDEQIRPLSFKNQFLCYQRRVIKPRVYLYEKLKDLPNGLVTIGNVHYDFNDDIPDHQSHHEHTTKELEIVSDIYTLGNQEVWQNSFLNVVSETVMPTWDYSFLSEKSFKPIIGGRPFIRYGSNRQTEMLREFGFETFDEDFGITPATNWQDCADQIYNVVAGLSDSDCQDLYHQLLPKIQHNRNHFATAAANEWKRLDQLIEKTLG